ncbi:MAG TPA: contractile injection system tape measure protein, partial [Bacteroidales bacterium]|nr:contractile injection system tape measure protein [Bacteroidales bacterium]
VKSYKTRFIELAEEIKELEKEMEASVSEEGLEQIEAFYIGNAGLVLLNVYMKRLFERLGFLDKKDFKSEEFRERAVYMLQYLVSKEVNPDENSLILNKLLVGMPLYNPLKFDINITDQEKEICDSLLDSVIKNWSVLKNTSRDGLRTSFFLRSGSLSEEETAWRLRVEKKAYDILLKKIPWGYTMIHFPWMKKPLSTEWEV